MSELCFDVMERCRIALEGNTDYMDYEQSNSCDLDILQIKAEKLCYRQGFKDAMAILIYSQKV